MRFAVWVVLGTLLLAGGGAVISGQDYLRLAELQKAQNTSWIACDGCEIFGADIMNASENMTPKISNGSYESKKYEIPLGPYDVSYELREDVSKSHFSVSYQLINETSGEGKTYHTKAIMNPDSHPKL